MKARALSDSMSIRTKGYSFLADSNRLARTIYPRRKASRAQVVHGQVGLNEGAVFSRLNSQCYARLTALHSGSHCSNSVPELICSSTRCTRYATPSLSSIQIKKKSMLVAPQFGNLLCARAMKVSLSGYASRHSGSSQIDAGRQLPCNQKR